MSWFDRIRPKAEQASLTLYTGPDCSLCEDVKAELVSLGAHRHFDLHEVDITTDRELKKRYGLSIPVLELDGEPIFSGKVDPAELRHALKAFRS